MNESYSRLANTIAAKKYSGQMDDIRRFFRHLDMPQEQGSGLIAIAVGAISGAIMAFIIAYAIWG